MRHPFKPSKCRGAHRPVGYATNIGKYWGSAKTPAESAADMQGHLRS